MPSGVLRMYPGPAVKKCDSYDPRFRPWYIAATSGPKDVLIIASFSESMGKDGKLELLKGAINAVLDTLTVNGT